ncbi:MAG: methyltransferase domain-containing protein [Patescibacteria group bacterium]|nr:methyltransferase domain-containing protein [Patescibacteria group bacterium]
MIKPYYLILKFLNQIPKGFTLDLGAGRGGDSFFLAKNGFGVEAIDIDKNSISEIKRIIQKNKLSIKAKCLDFKKFKFIPNKYSLILARQSLNFIKKSEFQKIIEKIKNSLIKNGIFIISAFTVKDSSFKKFKKKHQPIEENTFWSKKPPHWWHFFKKNELKKYFQTGFEILFYQERKIKDKKPISHFHYIVEIVARRK